MDFGFYYRWDGEAVTVLTKKKKKKTRFDIFYDHYGFSGEDRGDKVGSRENRRDTTGIIQAGNDSDLDQFGNSGNDEMYLDSGSILR